jgi:hypothetical protein
MRYEEPTPMSREEVAAAVASADPPIVCRALVSVALHDPDWEYAESLALQHVRDASPDVRRAAVTSLGHVARIHRKLHTDRVLPVLDELARDAELAGTVFDVRDDIATFLR